MYKVLFIPGGDIHVEMFAPIIKELSHCNVMAITLDKYSHDSHTGKALQELNIPFRRMQEYDNENVREALKLESPDIVVIGSETEAVSLLFTIAANAVGIPTLFIQEGIFYPREFGKALNHTTFRRLKNWLVTMFHIFIIGEYTPKQKLEFLTLRLKAKVEGRHSFYEYRECSRIAVMGEAGKNVLTTQGVDAKKIVVTGQPRFDLLLKRERFDDTIYAESKLTKDGKIILLTTQPLVKAGFWTVNERNSFIRAIARAVTSVPGCNLIIKLHPKEEMSEYRDILKEESIGETKIVKHMDTHILLKISDLLLTAFCTTALEAMILDKPVITIDLLGQRGDLVPYAKSGASLPVYREEDIAPAIKDALYNEEVRKKLAEARRKFVYEYAYLQDGQASKRVADLIVQMIEESRKAKSET